MHYILYSFWFLIVLLIPFVAQADNSTVPLHFFDKKMDVYVDAPGIASDIRTEVHGVLARTHVVQYFYNDTDKWREGRYIYPLPEDAAVDKLVMIIGERRVLGFVTEKQEARKIYEAARQEGRVAGIVEQHRPNIFKTVVANIPPQSIVAIEIAYQHEVRLKDDQFVLRLPMAITPRFDNLEISDFMTMLSANNGGSEAYEQVQRLGLFSFDDGKNPSQISLDSYPGFKVGRPVSSTHNIDVHKMAKNSYSINLKESIVNRDRDFILKWSKNKQENITNFMHYEAVDNSYFTYVFIAPGGEDIGDKNVRLLGPSNLTVRPRRVILVVDTSGSMSGQPIKQAKAAIREALYDLEPTDRFNVIRFDSRTEALFTKAAAVSEDHIKDALRWVDNLEAGGGTEMMPALRLALSDVPDQGDLSQIVFITDGAIGYEDKIAQELEYSLGNTRFFAVGIGAAPNTHLMDLFARVGRGSFTYIQNVKETQERMTALFEKMKSPVITDLTLVMDAGIQAEIIPSKLPDLLKGEALSVVIKSDKPIKKITLNGVKAGKAWRHRISAEGTTLEGVGKLYARKKVSDIHASNYGSDGAEMKAQIEALGVRHQILTKYTSFVAVDEEVIRPKNAILVAKVHNPNLPEYWQLAQYNPRDAARSYRAAQDDRALQGWSESTKIALPQTASGHMIRAVFGLMCLLCSCLAVVCVRCFKDKAYVL